MVKLLIFILSMVNYACFSTEVLESSDNSFLRFRGQNDSTPYKPLMPNNDTYEGSLVEEKPQKTDQINKLDIKNIDQDALFEDISVWEAYKNQQPSSNWLGYLLLLKDRKNFKAYYLLGEFYRLGKNRIHKDFFEASICFSRALMECAQDIERDMQILAYQYKKSYDPKRKKKLLQEIYDFKNNSEKRDHRLYEKKLVYALALRGLELCKKEQEKNAIESKKIIRATS